MQGCISLLSNITASQWVSMTLYIEEIVRASTHLLTRRLLSNNATCVGDPKLTNPLGLDLLSVLHATLCPLPLWVGVLWWCCDGRLLLTLPQTRKSTAFFLAVQCLLLEAYTKLQGIFFCLWLMFCCRCLSQGYLDSPVLKGFLGRRIRVEGSGQCFPLPQWELGQGPSDSVCVPFVLSECISFLFPHPNGLWGTDTFPTSSESG